jgi:hypothetical protein
LNSLVNTRKVDNRKNGIYIVGMKNIGRPRLTPTLATLDATALQHAVTRQVGEYVRDSAAVSSGALAGVDTITAYLKSGLDQPDGSDAHVTASINALVAAGCTQDHGVRLLVDAARALLALRSRDEIGAAPLSALTNTSNVHTATLARQVWQNLAAKGQAPAFRERNGRFDLLPWEVAMEIYKMSQINVG